MKDIKFRIYFKNTNELTQPFISEFDFDGTSYKLSDFYDEDLDYIGYVDVEQYTGLKDKNGVEIYEGDNIKDTNYHRPLEVKYINGMFCVEYDDKTLGFPHEQFREVIGNIHEVKE